MSRRGDKKGADEKKVISPLAWLGIAAAAGIIFAGAGFGFAASREQDNSFCASCHTQPESTYVTRNTAQSPVDLASQHNLKKTKCIDCHSGAGVRGKLGAELLGARNAMRYYSGTAVQPAVMQFPIGDGNCLKCHAEVFTRAGRDNHFHEFLPRWQKADANAASCVNCHESHITSGEAQIAFLDRTATEKVCNQCHAVLGGGD